MCGPHQQESQLTYRNITKMAQMSHSPRYRIPPVLSHCCADPSWRPPVRTVTMAHTKLKASAAAFVPPSRCDQATVCAAGRMD